MAYCDEHKAHSEHFRRINKRLEQIETRTYEIEKLIARVDTLVASMQRLQWILVTAIVGMAVSWILRISM